MLNFNPGPSQISPFVRQCICDYTESTYLDCTHRSQEFSMMSEKALSGLRRNLLIPEDYKIFYQSSATMCMDTILRNLVSQNSFHFVNGAFSERFFLTAKELCLKANLHTTPFGEPIDWKNALIPSDNECIALTHNESATCVMWPQKDIKELQQAYPNQLIVLDSTSTLGGSSIPWKSIDCCFGSVQKCFGLPSGLALLIISPRAYEKSLGKHNTASSYQNFNVLARQIETNYQTLETPNMFLIGLLAKIMENWDLNAIESRLHRQMEKIINAPCPWKPFVANKEWRSHTLANLITENPSEIIAKAKANKIAIGSGYGPLKEHCIRLANFPSILEEHIDQLITLFR